MATACLEPSAQLCADGSVCPPGRTCATAAAMTICALPDQLDACRDAADGTRCATSEIVVGVCTSNVCISSGCGNGVEETDEACDDGNLESGDGCSADCSSDETCGNNIIDRGEQCDCGSADAVNPDCPGPNSETSGLCRPDCRLRCGDGVLSPDEGCDPGLASMVSCAGAVFDRGVTMCSPSCQPVISLDTCRFIGFRSRTKQPTGAGAVPTLELAATSATAGFFVTKQRVGTYDNYVGTGNPYVSNMPLAGVWAASTTMAVAVGAQGKIVHHNAGTWTTETSGTTADLRDVWGRAANDIYAVGPSTVLHFNGSSWSSLAPPAGDYHAISGDATRIFVVGAQGTVAIYDGVSWKTEDPGTTADLLSVWMSHGVVMAVGAAGTIVQRDSTGTWTPGRTTATVTLRGVWGSAVDGYFSVGDAGTVLFFDGRVWRPLSLGRGVTGSPDQDFTSITGLAGQAIGIIGDEDLASYEGAAWSPTIQPSAQTIYGLWGSAPDNIFAIGRNGTILHHDGLTWTAQPTPTTADLRAIHGIAADDVYATGDDRTLLHYDGDQWTEVATTAGTSALSSIFALAADDVLAAGSDGVYRYDGNTLLQISAQPRSAIWASSATNVWTAGPSIEHFNGASWTIKVGPTDVRALAGSSATSIFAVGKSPYHFNGTSWQPGPFLDTRLTAVCTTSNIDAFAVGREGTLRHWDGVDIEPFISHTTTDLHAVFMTGKVLVMAGADGTLDTLVFHR